MRKAISTYRASSSGEPPPSTPAWVIMSGPSAQATVTAPPRRRSLVGTASRREVLYLLGTALQMVVAAGVTPIITRAIGPGQFGRVAAGMAVMQVLVCFECLGLAVGVQRAHAQAADGGRHAYGLLGFSLASACAFTVLLVATASLWSGPLGFGDALGALRIAIVWSGFTAVTAVFLALFRSEDRLGVFSVVNVLETVFSQVVALGLVAFVHRSASMYLLGLAIGEAAALAVAWAHAPPRLSGALLRRAHLAVLAFTLPLIPAELAGFVLNTSDRLVVQSKLGAASVGRYSLAYNLAGMGATLLVVLNVVWMPVIFSAHGAERIRILVRTRDQLLKMTQPLMLGIAAGGPAVLVFWAPPTFHPASLVVVTTLVALSTLAMLVYTSEYRVLVVEGRTVTVAVATGLGAAANVVLNLVLVPRLGIDGSALATLISFGVLAAVAHVVAHRVQPLPGVGPRRWGSTALIAGLAGATMVVPVHGVFFPARLMVGAACLAWFLATLRTVSPFGGMATGPGS